MYEKAYVGGLIEGKHKKNKVCCAILRNADKLIKALSDQHKNAKFVVEEFEKFLVEGTEKNNHCKNHDPES